MNRYASAAKSRRDNSGSFGSSPRGVVNGHGAAPVSLIHSVTAAQRLPQLSFSVQFGVMLVGMLQLLAAAAALLAKAIGSHSAGLKVAARILLLTAPVTADTDINPLVYHVLFIFMVVWSLASTLAIVIITVQSTSIAR